jgi:glycosyltransferase involved in cell wall biosynthesis
MTTSKKPKVALMTYAIDNRPAKGSALYARKLVEHLIARDEYDYCLVHYEACDDPIYTLGAHEIIMPLVRLPFGTRFVRQLLFFWKYRHDRFDLVHWFQPRVYPFFWLAPARHTVVTAHGAGDITAPGVFSLSRLMFNVVLKHANHYLSAIIGDSEFAREEIIEFYHTNPAITHNIPLGGAEDFHLLTPDHTMETLRRYGIDREYILTVSRHVRHKNIARLVAAYDELRAQHPERNELLVVVGARSLAYNENEARRTASPFADDIRFIEFIQTEDLNALYAGARVMAFPSLNEGFGLPVIEAFASGVPVITASTTALGEVAGDAAITIDPLDQAALTAALARVLSDTELREELMRKGLARAAQFTWKETAAHTANLYQRLLAHQ